METRVSSRSSEAPIRHLARRGGVKRISGLIYEEIRGIRRRISGLVYKNLLRLWKESDASRLVASSRYSEAPVRRLARRGGVKRISGLIYEETRGIPRIF
ncbi:hypothetical protein PAXINDRAFT_19291 [Paxillus involutus ATCC 200175]|uniref:Histone H4 n=1 Tax=Paxillus involutus ATCC 200175 TaxID=664439 RepID=A0A0C9T8Q3_PAXIN|nr:hypothetical protein PAXINDRAFT_19291 [Paxillus involutus ATCC 200175]